MSGLDHEQVQGFLAALGLKEEPMGMYYTNSEPEKGFVPKPTNLPTKEMEDRGEIDWQATFSYFSCVLSNIWLARQKKTAAYFDRQRFGCLGGAFYLGFAKPQLDFITYYVSTGIPGQMEGERYLESPQVCRHFFDTVNPPPAPARFCVFKPVSQFAPGEQPEVVIFFARAEIICGLNQLATFVTNDFEAVSSPFGAGCTNIVTWPLRYLSQGKLKAVLGGWDPSDRKFFRPDEISFAVPYEMFDRMVRRWPESFLTTETWATVKKKIARSYKVWKED